MVITRAWVARITFAGLYIAALVTLSRVSEDLAANAVGAAVIFGFGLSILALILGRGLKASPLPARQPVVETWVTLGLVILVIVWQIYGPGLIDPLAGDDPRARMAIILVRKVLVLVVLPYLVFRIVFGYRWADFGLSGQALVALKGPHAVMIASLGLALLVFQWVIGAGAAPIREGEFQLSQLAVGLPLAFGVLMIEVGLVEEFLFRVLLLERVAAAFHCSITGLCVSSVLFGLVHAPGYVLRGAASIEGLGTAPDWPTALAYGLAVPGIVGIPFGILWLKTRNLYALMIVHAATDLFPNAPDWIRAWTS